MEGSLSLATLEHESTDVLQKQETNLVIQYFSVFFGFSDTSVTTNMTASHLQRLPGRQGTINLRVRDELFNFTTGKKKTKTKRFPSKHSSHDTTQYTSQPFLTAETE